MAIDYFDMDVRVKFGDYRSNGSRDIGIADFVSNKRTNITKPVPAIFLRQGLEILFQMMRSARSIIAIFFQKLCMIL